MPKFKARLFQNGRSQAVRLPKDLRFEGDEVYLWKEGDRVILEPVPRQTWPAGFWERLDELGAQPELEIEPLNPGFLDLDL